MKRWLVIVNPHSAANRTHQLAGGVIEVLNKTEGVEVSHRFTEEQGHGTILAREAIHEGFDAILSLGGDGTNNEVINGFFTSDGERLPGSTAFGLIPSGTGGDLARNFYAVRTPLSVAESLNNWELKTLDVGRSTLSLEDGTTTTRMFVNVASIGLTAEIGRRMTQSNKKLGGRVGYYLGFLKTVFSYPELQLELTRDNDPPQKVHARCIAVANGAWFGGGANIAPGAQVADGVFDVVVIGVGRLKLLTTSPKFYSGKHLSTPGIEMVQSQKIHIQSVHDKNMPVLVETDGEDVGQLPATFEVLPDAVPLLLPRPLP
ncbi:MAG: hypothetical protein CMH54_07100 [Myxococcales bacterium]|mgnify:CR=1 FL=1|nr:hypothetical protein [Myxococcales bacterium]